MLKVHYFSKKDACFGKEGQYKKTTQILGL